MTNIDYKMVLLCQNPTTKLLLSHYKKNRKKFKVTGTQTILNFPKKFLQIKIRLFFVRKSCSAQS